MRNSTLNFLELLLFDLDGTITDSKKDISEAINYLLNYYSLPPIEEAVVKSFIGDGIGKLLDRCFTYRNSTPPEDCYGIFADFYERNCLNNTRIYKGFLDFIRAIPHLKKVVITNKAERFTKVILKGLKLDCYFDLILGGDSLPKTKPDPFPLKYACEKLKIPVQKTMMIGDSSKDILPAKEIGMLSGGVLFGYSQPQVIKDLKPDFLISSYEQFRKDFFSNG